MMIIIIVHTLLLLLLLLLNVITFNTSFDDDDDDDDDDGGDNIIIIIIITFLIRLLVLEWNVTQKCCQQVSWDSSNGSLYIFKLKLKISDVISYFSYVRFYFRYILLLLLYEESNWVIQNRRSAWLESQHAPERTIYSCLETRTDLITLTFDCRLR